MLSKSFHKVVQKLCQSFVKVVSKLCLICLKVVSNLFRRCLDIFSLMCQSYHKVVPKLSASCLFGAQVWSMQFSNGANWHGSCPKWCPSVALVVPNWGQKVSIYATMWPRDVSIECLWSCISGKNALMYCVVIEDQCNLEKYHQRWRKHLALNCITADALHSVYTVYISADRYFTLELPSVRISNLKECIKEEENLCL